MPALDSIKDHHKSQGKGNTPVSTTGRPRKVVALRFGQSRKRPLPKRADIGKSTTINSENQRTESESSEEEDSKPTQNAAKRLKRDKDVEDVSSASKPREESVITEGDKTNPVRVEDSTGPGSPKSPVHDLRQQSRSARIADNLPRNQRNPKRKPDSLSRPRQAPGTRSKAKTHLSQTIRSHSLPPTPAEDFNATFKGHADREMSHTLEPEPISRRAVRAERLFRDKNVQSSTRKTRVAVEFWILVTGVPKRAWIQWSDASLSTQTVRTMFQTLNEYSHLRDIEAADVQFQTSEETWTFRIKEGDEEKFEDMKSHIKTRVQASLTKNRNRNQNFFIHISPIGVDEVADNLEGDVAFENIEG